MAEPVISEIKYLGNGPEDFVEVAIPDDYPSPENLRLVVYDRTTNLPTEVYVISTDGAVDPAGEVNGYTKYIVGSDYDGTNIRLHRDDAVGLYDSVTGETFGLYTFETGDSFTVSGSSGDPFAGETAVTLPGTSSGGSLQIDSTGSYTPINPPTPYSTDDTDPLCFVSGTLIETPNGAVSVEALQIGDFVLTKDNGPQEIIWIGSSTKRITDENRDIIAPYLIEKSTFSQNVPNQDLCLSPLHMIVLSGGMIELLFDDPEVLVSVKGLRDHPKIRRLSGKTVEYWHIATKNHDLVRANGVWAETLYLGPQAKRHLTQAQITELVAIFPEIMVSDGLDFSICRPKINPREARLVAGYSSGSD